LNLIGLYYYENHKPIQSLIQGKKQIGLYNTNCINTNYEHVCNINSHFKDNINLLNSHPSVLSHC